MTKLRNTKAFTLIELVAVIIILGILALIALFAYNTIINNSREATLNAAGVQVGTTYKADTGVAAAGGSATEAEAASALTAASGELTDMDMTWDTSSPAFPIPVAVSDQFGNCISTTVSADPTANLTWSAVTVGAAGTGANEGTCV